jgi:hypothetical protein
MDSNLSVVAGIFFCLLVLFGSFFLLNLILAVIMDAFDNVDKNSGIKSRHDGPENEEILLGNSKFPHSGTSYI